jgi:hypothetical protein
MPHRTRAVCAFLCPADAAHRSERRPAGSVYVGIDVHRKRSQVAVVDQSGEVFTNRNVPNGAEPILKVIGGLPPGTPAAFEAVYGTSWLVELLEDCGFAPHLAYGHRSQFIRRLTPSSKERRGPVHPRTT